MISAPSRDQDNGEILRAILDESRPLEIVNFLRSLSIVDRCSLVPYIKKIEQERKLNGPVVSLKSCSGLLLASAGLFDSTADLSAWIDMYGRDLRDSDGNSIICQIVDALRFRDRLWHSRLLRRLTSLPNLSPDQVALILAVARATQIEVPVTDRLVLAWVKANCRAAQKTISPGCEQLVRRIVAVPGTGRFLVNRSGQDDLAIVIAAAPRSPRIRAELLDNCLSAICHPGTAADLQGYLTVYHALAPSPRELEPRMQRFARFLCNHNKPVVQLAQNELFRLYSSGRIHSATWLRSTRTVFRHPDGHTVLTQLGQLTQVLAKEPSAAEVGMHLLVNTLLNHDGEVAGRARQLADQYAPKASAKTRALLAAAYHNSIARDLRKPRVQSLVVK
jgi:hypothetical protein